jgi:hypothetical protein
MVHLLVVDTLHVCVILLSFSLAFNYAKVLFARRERCSPYLEGFTKGTRTSVDSRDSRENTYANHI